MVKTHWFAALVLLLACFGVQAQETLRVVLLTGDTIQLQATALAAAASGLRSDKALNNAAQQVRLTVVAAQEPSSEQLATLDAADLVLLHSPPVTLAARLSALAQDSNKKVWDISPEPHALLQEVPYDATLAAYAAQGDARNLQAMLQWAVYRHGGLSTNNLPPPQALPAMALWDVAMDTLYTDFAAFEAAHVRQQPEQRGRPWIGVVASPAALKLGERAALRAIAQALAQRGFHTAVLVAGDVGRGVAHFWLDKASGDTPQSRIVAGILLAKSGISAAATGAVLQQLDVPWINTITLANATSVANKSAADWQGSAVGLTVSERFSQVFQPELVGAFAPTIVATGERVRDAHSGLHFIQETPMPERIARLVERVQQLVALKTTPALEKRVALMYYHDHGGPEGMGADFLNQPQSLLATLHALRGAGYRVGDAPPHDAPAMEAALTRYGLNAKTPGALAELVAAGRATLLPLATYQRWLAEQPAALRQAIERVWGPAEKSPAMLWKNAEGQAFFVFPTQRLGNILLAPQPMRGWGLDIRRAYEVNQLPPSHQYLAFFLWLQRDFQPHAVVNMGAHGTVEWLPGRDFGFMADDPGEIMLAATPQFYPFVTSNQGDATVARHRGMAAIISHLTPPMARVTLNKALLDVQASVEEYLAARQKSEIAEAGSLAHLNTLAQPLGLLKDIGLAQLNDIADVQALYEHLKDISERNTYYGLHTFGRAPDEKLRLATADAIMALDDEATSPTARAKRQRSLAALLADSGPAEMQALLHALAGGYLPAGPGGNPARKPEALPTGRNMYSHDPTALPTRGAWAQGQALADDFVRQWQTQHGSMPKRVSFAGLWDSARGNGVAHAQILAFMGVRPVWNERAIVTGVEIIPRAQLGRARVDVTLVGGGGHGSMTHLSNLIDQAASLAKAEAEPDNPIRQHVQQAALALQAQGIGAHEAERMATVRVFGAPAGVYGTGIDNVVPASNSWAHENELVQVYYQRMGHLYGQGYSGNQGGGSAVGTQVFQLALSGSVAALNTYSGDTVASLDHSATYRHIGGVALAVRHLDGTSPQMTVVNTEGRTGKLESLDRFMGRELRARYTNPEWVKAMLEQGQSGASAIKEVNERLWAWQVVTPEVVDAAKWQEMYETYVADRNQLNIRERFRQAGGLLAYQAMVDRMLVAIHKGYWQADAQVQATLEQVNREVIAEAGVACDAESCSSADIVRLAQDIDQRKLAQANTALAMPSPPNNTVRGQELREVPHAPSDSALHWPYALIVLAAFLLGSLHHTCVTSPRNIP